MPLVNRNLKLSLFLLLNFIHNLISSHLAEFGAIEIFAIGQNATIIAFKFLKCKL